MQTSGTLSNDNSLRLTPQQSLRRLGLCSQVATGQHSSPIVYPEKRGKVKASRHFGVSVTGDDLKKAKREEHKIDIVDEQSDLLGYVVFSGKLILDKGRTLKNSAAQTSTENVNQDAVDAKLTSKALVWSSRVLSLEDVISVSYNVGLRHFTVHTYPMRKAPCGLSCFMKSGRSRKDIRFLASSSEDALQWVSGFADQQCFVNCLPHPLKQTSDMVVSDFAFGSHIKSKSPPKMLVILNPRSGRGRSSKVFHGMVEPIFKVCCHFWNILDFYLEILKCNATCFDACSHLSSLQSCSL
ncbi:sphingosine kinase [Sarracenia purpurea var. burkii]